MSLKAVIPSYRNVSVYVDADIVAFRAAYIGESGHSAGLAISIANEMLDTIATNLNVDVKTLQLCFTSSDNYRKIIDPEYKANRKDKPKPKYLADVRDYLESSVSRCPTMSYDSLEADDIVCGGDIIASVDKDLLQIPGLHYNLTTQQTIRVSDIDAEHNLLIQVLTGDATDNIQGLKGIGPKKAEKLLELNTFDDQTLNEKLTMCLNIYRTRGYAAVDFLRCLNSVYVQRRGEFGLWFVRDNSVVFCNNYLNDPVDIFTTHNWGDYEAHI